MRSSARSGDPVIGRRAAILGAAGLAGLGLVAGCAAARPSAPRRIGMLSGGPRSPANEAHLSSLWRGLADAGYVDGESLLIEARFAGGDDKLDAPAAELARLSLEVIVASSTAVARVLRAATAVTPIVSISSGEDLVGAGLAASHAHPGGTVTGLQTPQLIGKQLQLFREAVPTLARLLVLVDATKPLSARDRDRGAAEEAGQVLGLETRFVSTRGSDDLETGLAAAAREQPDGLFVTTGPLINAFQTRIAEAALGARLPSMWQLAEAVRPGALMGHGPNVTEMYQRGALYVDRILKGARPGDLPIEEPTRFDFGVNLKTAEALGLTIPPSILQQATEVIR